MRNLSLGLVVIATLSFSVAPRAQVYLLPEAPPQVTAATAEWQIKGEPIYYEGNFYYSTGPDVFFDGSVMARTGMYRGVPLYQDRTLEPYSIVFVPVGGTRMRPYERLRAGDLAGTTGSRAPSLVPVSRPTVELASFSITKAEEASGEVGTTGNLPEKIESIPAPSANRGIWIEYDGAQWYSAGRAVPFESERFVRIGAYNGFDVYRAKTGSLDEIHVRVAPDGPVAPYRR